MATNNAANQGVILSDGQLLMGNTGGRPSANILSSANGSIQITTGPGSITLAAAGSVNAYSTVSGTTQTLVAYNGYIANNASLITFTLPVTTLVGENYVIMGLGAGGWTIAQNSGQTIKIGPVATTTGVGGSLSSTNQYDVITLVCVVNNTTFDVLSFSGNLTYV